MTETLRERVRERLIDLIAANEHDYESNCVGIADAILREFRLQPVAVGKVTGEGEVEGL